MKILFIGDYSNVHACLAAELRRIGHQATVISDRGTYMRTHADITLVRQPGPVGGMRYLYDLFKMLPDLKGYDAVQLINPNFLSLRPGKIKYFFDRLRAQNGSMFLTLAGNDYFFVKACMDARMFRFSEFKVGDTLTPYFESHPGEAYGWISDVNRRWSEYLYEKIDGAMSVLPEYDMASRPVLGERLAFTNLPVDLSSLPFSPLPHDKPVTLFVGMRSGREMQKGTDVLLRVARGLEEEMPGKVKAEKVQDVSLSEYLSRMRGSHIVLDQLYSYSPATNALQAMALGKVAGSGAQPEFYEYIGHPAQQPVFPLSPLEPDIRERLRNLILDPDRMQAMAEQGRRLVEAHNDVAVVAPKFVSHWEKLSK